ncbi:hypothetical protein K7432_017810, partial [Basidiobolus ranarum]
MKFLASGSLLFLTTLQITTALPSYGSEGNKSTDYCQSLIIKVNALGAHLDANVCIGRFEEPGHNTVDVAKMDCNDLVAAVKALGIKVKAGLCSGNGNGGHESGYKQGDVEDYNDSSEGEGGDYNEDHPGNGNGGYDEVGDDYDNRHGAGYNGGGGGSDDGYDGG